MTDKWLLWSEKYTALPVREKWLIFIVGLFLLAYLTIWFVIAPLQSSYMTHQTRITTISRQHENAVSKLAMLQNALQRDYTSGLVTQENEINAEIKAINHELAEFSLSYISPKKMARVLQELLQRHKEITLSHFNINPVEPIYVHDLSQTKQSEQSAVNEIAFYQHTMSLQLKGSYFSLLSYLNQIKKIQEKLFIQEFDYQVETYPTGKLTLTIATVSANDKFITL